MWLVLVHKEFGSSLILGTVGLNGLSTSTRFLRSMNSALQSITIESSESLLIIRDERVSKSEDRWHTTRIPIEVRIGQSMEWCHHPSKPV